MKANVRVFPRNNFREWLTIKPKRVSVKRVKWLKRAMCNNDEVREFFWVDDNFGSGTPSFTVQERALRKTIQAKAICGVCPVRMECLMDSVKENRFTPVSLGVWGGTTESERLVFFNRGYIYSCQRCGEKYGSSKFLSEKRGKVCPVGSGCASDTVYMGRGSRKMSPTEVDRLRDETLVLLEREAA